MQEKKQVVDISYESIIRVILVVFVLALIFFLKNIIFIVFISVIVALIMNPAVDYMQKRKRIPRVLGAASLFFTAIAFLGLLVYIVAPPLTKEVIQLSSDFPKHLSELGIDYPYLENKAFDYNISEPMKNILIEAGNSIKNLTANLVYSILGLLGGLLSAILIFVISFYLVVEERGIEKFVQEIMPYDLRERASKIVRKIEVKLAKWFIGQLFLGFIVGLLSFVGLLILGVPYALVLGIIAGVMELIPYIGPTLSGIPAILIAFTVSPVLAVLTLLLYFLIQQFENYLIVPKVMEKSVGLHPVVIIIAILIGGQLAGTLGIILAIPVTTIISIIVEDIYSNK